MYCSAKILHKAIPSILLIGCCCVHASDDNERVVLARLFKEINYLEKIIVQAEKQKIPQGRTLFDYSTLRNDLELIKEGIRDYINSERREPKSLENIVGEYKS